MGTVLEPLTIGRVPGDRFFQKGFGTVWGPLRIGRVPSDRFLEKGFGTVLGPLRIGVVPVSADPRSLGTFFNAQPDGREDTTGTLR